MDDIGKVYTPIVIEDTALPQQGQIEFATTTPSSGGTYKPTEIDDQPLPTKRIAVELLGQALNTRSRKILAEFQFTEMGAIQIGKYTQGVSGDLRISPNGITARNLSGLTTFALDGDSGDAYFAGTIQAGTVISGLVVVGDNGVNIDGDSKSIAVFNGAEEAVRLGLLDNGTYGLLINDGKITIKNDSDITTIDSKGIVSTANFSASSVQGSAGTQTTSSTSFVDVTGVTINIVLSRTENVLLFGIASGAILANDSTGHNCVFQVLVGSTQVGGNIYTPGKYTSAGWLIQNGSSQEILSLGAGTHTLKLQFRTTNGSSLADAFTGDCVVGYVVLGN